MVYTLADGTQMTRRKRIPITGQSSGAQTDFQIPMAAVAYATAMQNDFDDLRFTQADMQTLIDAWLEDKSDGVSADVWGEFPTTPANGATEDYWMYYGNAGAASDWDGVATFVAFFDGDATGWTEVDPNSHIAFVNNRLEFTGLSRNEDAYVYKSIAGFTDGFFIDYSWLLSSVDGNHNTIFFSIGDMVDDGANIDNSIRNSYQGSSYNYLGRTISDVRGWSNANTGTVLNTQYWVELYVVSGTAYMKVYSDSTKNTQVGSTVSLDVSGLTLADLDITYIIQSWNSGNAIATTGWIDDYRLRKYVANPPTATLGTEEHQRRTPQFM